MLDSEIKAQLNTVFQQLENEITLAFYSGAHADQGELEEMLSEVRSTSSKISLKRLQRVGSTNILPPEFFIEYKGEPTGISFKGIPGGHEFTSLVIAILNTDGKGKMPEAALKKRIRSLKGPIRIQTFISLTCENCPEVVQALNQMALIHKDFHHQMVDGGYVQDEVTTLGIQGVPSVIVDAKMIHSGRIGILDLLTKLEKQFGVDSSVVGDEGEVINTDLGQYDVAVIGGGPAGISAAIYTARKGLKTALIAERLGGQVQDTMGIENLISVPYTEGPQLAAQLFQHVSAYPVEIVQHRRVKEIRNAEIKTVEFESGEKLVAKSIILATGARWRELGIPGEKEYVGRGVAYCPHCDGPFYKGKKVAVVGGGNSGVEAAIDLAGIVKEVVLFEFNEHLKADEILVKKLKSLTNVSIVTSARTTQILAAQGKVAALEYEDRKTKKLETVDLDGVFIQIGLIPNTQFIKGLVELSKHGEIIIDEKGRTSTPGIYAAGDVTTVPYKQIIIAMGEGAKAALATFEDQLLN